MRTLFGYYRSSASFRVRIALALKGLEYKYESVNLLPGISEHKSPEYREKNPQLRVPYYVDDMVSIGQSLAIITYLDERYPTPSLMPDDLVEKTRVRQLALMIACDTHPYNNLSVLEKLKVDLVADDGVVNEWYHHWIIKGFTALEAVLNRDAETGRFCHGDTVTIADLCLVPQVWNARRFKVPLDAFPSIVRIDEECRALDAFKAAAPENQPDTPV